MSTDFLNSIIRLLEEKEKEARAVPPPYMHERRAEDRERLTAALAEVHRSQ